MAWRVHPGGENFQRRLLSLGDIFGAAIARVAFYGKPIIKWPAAGRVRIATAKHILVLSRRGGHKWAVRHNTAKAVLATRIRGHTGQHSCGTG